MTTIPARENSGFVIAEPRQPKRSQLLRKPAGAINASCAAFVSGEDDWQRPRPTKRCWPRGRRSIHEAVELSRILTDDLASGGVGQVAELALDVVLRIGPDAVGVWKVRGPHDVALADLVDQLDADRIGLISRIALAAPILARRHLQIE